MKTASQIEGDIYNLLKADPTLCSMISGQVYREGYRPRDSKQEDVIVIFTAGEYGQIETGVVTINIYVPDIDPYSNGVMVKDGLRTSELEQVAAMWVQSLTADRTNYKFRLQQTIYTEAEPDIHQHFIVVSLHYRYYDKGNSEAE